EKKESSDDDADEKHAEQLQNKMEHVKQQMRDPDLTQAQLKLLMAKLDQLEAMLKESRAAPAAAASPKPANKKKKRKKQQVVKHEVESEESESEESDGEEDDERLDDEDEEEVVHRRPRKLKKSRK